MKFLNLFFLVITLMITFASAKVEVLNKKNFNKVNI